MTPFNVCEAPSFQPSPLRRGDEGRASVIDLRCESHTRGRSQWKMKSEFFRPCRGSYANGGPTGRAVGYLLALLRSWQNAEFANRIEFVGEA